MSENTPPDEDVTHQPGLAEAVRFQRDLYLYWRTARSLGGLPLTRRRFVTRPTLRRLRAALAIDPGAIPTDDERAEADEPRLFFVRRLLERLGLLVLAPDGTRLLSGPDDEMERYLSLPLAARIRSNVRLWVAGGWWPDRPDAKVEPPRVRVPAPPKLAIARRRLIESLVALVPGEAIPLPALDPAPGNRLAARREAPRLRLLPRMPAPTASASDAPFAALDLRLPETGATVRAALDGPLRWLGLVEAGDAEAVRAGSALAVLRAGVDATRAPTHRARASLAEADQDALDLPEKPGRVVIQPDLSVLAFPPLTAPALHLLDRVAEAAALDTTARYRLSEPALARALRQGWDVPRVVAALEALAGVPLPENVRVLLGDWARRGERIRLIPDATLLEVARPAVLDALLREPGARGWVERQLTPTAALLKPESVGAVRAWLLRHGEFPALGASEAGPSASSPAPEAPMS